MSHPCTSTTSTPGTNDRTEATSTAQDRLQSNADDITKHNVQKGDPDTKCSEHYMLELCRMEAKEGDDIIQTPTHTREAMGAHQYDLPQSSGRHLHDQQPIQITTRHLSSTILGFIHLFPHRQPNQTSS
jgi:hypothetical protein